MLRFHYPTLDSTSTQAARLAAANPHRPLLVSAQAQSAGRGRHGRQWRSPRGGAWFSIAWPTAMPAERAAVAPLVVGLAVMQAVQHCAPGDSQWADGLSLKWPNDLLLNGAKLAGMLCEQTLQPGRARRTLIAGVGLNANIDPDALGSDLRQPAASLRAALGSAVDVPRLIADAAARIALQLDSLERHGLTAAVLDQLNAHLAWRDQTIRLQRADQAVQGVLRGIDAEGKLLLEQDGEIYACHSGEVQAVRAVDAQVAV